MMTGAEYIESLRRLKTEVYFMGQRVESVVDHPAIRPHVNTAAVTYDLAHDPEYADLASAVSHLTGRRINRWTHIPQNQEDLVKKVKMLRVAGQITGTCFQRCVGMDALITLYSVTHDVDKKYGTDYHERFKRFLIETQDRDLMSGGAMTDPKGDRSKRPHEQHDPDLFVRVVERRSDGIVVRGAKMHQTGAVNSHQFIVLPGQSLGPEDKDYAVAFAVPADAPGVIQVFGRQVNDSRKWEGKIDQGNPTYGVVGGEALVIFDDVFVPYERVFLLGEWEFASTIVERFTAYHRQNYGGCKSGNLDVLIGATLALAEMQGTAKASHVRDKLAEMAHMVETMYGGALACSYECTKLACGTAFVNPLLANTAKLNTARYYPEVTRLAQDIAGGFVATMPSERELDNPRVGQFIRKYYQTRADVPAEDRIRLGRLVENMTGATPIIECMHGAGSPQAQKVVVQRLFDWVKRRRLAERIAGVGTEEGR
ncbi:4-hydroxyphenylacetate 3-hydroxylase family protein [Caldinitratiruptor microaerophilus]|uniref:4-hydroxybutyryl-CoA dehydratase n=1 Tax=Caldinitratiruptor microaerophilus TaxID=671077 RepID=A0AA35G809_9FIRM|nr:4-hydroxyphenylacetate 3-hydroxylase family protein [Caldinitratiruptor microaerophilus]BDG60485.1 4-hydroxybutyryl-CoA dehydratase [Caldinitratiruptor microaerophilus]